MVWGGYITLIQVLGGKSDFEHTSRHLQEALSHHVIRFGRNKMATGGGRQEKL